MKYLIGMETQVPYHNKAIWKSWLYFVQQYRPDKIIGIGDHLDCPGISRWNRGTALEWEGTLYKEAQTMKAMFSQLRNYFDGPILVHEGNHERRINVYASTRTPGFGLLSPTVGSVLDYKGFDIVELDAINVVAPGWVTTHDFGGKKKVISKIAGQTAMAYARSCGKSVVMGHTHRLAHTREMVGGRLLHGVETGHMMAGADYVAFPNWASGWVTMEVSQGRVHVETVDVSKSGVVSFRE